MVGDDTREFKLNKGAVFGLFLWCTRPHIGYVVCFSLDWGFSPNSAGQEKRMV